MKPLLAFWMLVVVFAGAGCAHNPPQAAVLVLDDPDFTRATGIDRLFVIPTEVPEVRVSPKNAGSYHCRLWSQNRQHVRICQADSGVIELARPGSIRVVAAGPFPGYGHDYLFELNYCSLGGESARLVRLVAAWW